MKELKAYIRPWSIEETVKALQEAGAPGITIVDVHPVGYGFEPNFFSQSREISRLTPEIVKLEMTCHNEQVDEFVKIILDKCQTGEKGDGRIFIQDVEEAIRVRDRQRGADIL
jgi:nitrogen regulatory protein P-II 1